MKTFHCNFVRDGKPESLFLASNDTNSAVCEALSQLHSKNYTRLELIDEQGRVILRQVPNRLRRYQTGGQVAA